MTLLEPAAAPEKPIVPKIGIIYPPPEIRNTVDKTANFVARNGPDFESRIRQNEINNPKFNFLNPADPYHAYYQHKVKEFTEGKTTEPPTIKVPQSTTTKLVQEAPKAIQETFVPKDPPKEFEFVYDPPSIAAQDIDIVKLTAQFVARNGRQFLSQLMGREQRNYQFDFLRAQHSMFGYFTKLVEQYTKILIPPKDLVKRLQDELAEPHVLMEQVRYRMNWQRYEERQRKQEEEALEKERVAYAMIDWHDFVIVETVDFPRNEAGNFPVPTTPEEVGARVIARERGDDTAAPQANQPKVPPVPGSGEVDLDEDDGLSDDETAAAKPAKRAMSPVAAAGGDDMELSDEEGEATAMPPPPPMPASSTSVDEDEERRRRSLLTGSQPPTASVVVRDYNPKVAAAARQMQDPASNVLLISPFTGEKIPASQAPKHVRVGLLDPKWVEQKDREIRQRQDEDQVYASGSHISSSLKNLAERRRDIFGIGQDDKAVEQKLAEEDRLAASRVMWDGYSVSKDVVSRRAQKMVTPQQREAYMAEELRREAELDRIGPSGVLPTPPPPPPPPAKRPKDQ